MILPAMADSRVLEVWHPRAMHLFVAESLSGNAKKGRTTMNQGRSGFNLFVAIFFVMLGLCASTPSIHAQDNPNTITFDNKSGESALVKLIGPTGHSVEVPNGESWTVNTAAGEYYILTRYGSKPGGYKYTKGDPFTVVQTESEYSIITITLHPVIGGNYATYPISADEFEKAYVTGESLSPPQIQPLPKIEPLRPLFLQPLPKIDCLRL